MSSPARPSAPEPRAVLAAAWLAAAAGAPVPASAGCSGREIGVAARHCETRSDQVRCEAMLNSLWFDCQDEERVKGRPYPRLTGEGEGTGRTGANPGGVVFALRKQFGLPTFPETAARSDRSERDIGYWREERSPGESQRYYEAASRNLTEEQALSRFGGAPGAPSTPSAARTLKATAQDSAQDADQQRVRPEPADKAGIPVPRPVPEKDEDIPPQFRMAAAAATGNQAAAKAAAEQLLARNPNDVGALGVRMRGRMLAGDRDGAFQDARRVLRVDPANEDARNILGGSEAIGSSVGKVSRMKVGLDPMNEDAGGPAGGPRPEERGGARAGGPEAGRAEEGRAGALPELGYDAGPAAGARGAQLAELAKSALRFSELGDFATALREASRLVTLDPSNPDAWLLRSQVSMKMGNWEAAESDARKALELRPDDPAALLMLGRALVKQGKAVDGLAVIERALAMRESAIGRFYRAEALEALGRRPEAVSEYRRAAELDPALQPMVDEALARLLPGAVPAPGRMPPLKKAYRLFVALIGSLFLLKGLHFLVAQRSRTAFASAETTTRPPMRLEDAHEHAGREPIAGDVLGGNFRVERELARGGMGVVYLATDITLRRPVAIKRLHRDATQTEETRRKFLQEAQLAAKLKHPNMAQIHSVFGERELHLVFELVEGRTLEALLAERGRLTLQETRAIVRQVCKVLELAHGQRVIHRDLKPANIMLAGDGMVKVMDFGIAHQARTGSAPTMTQAWGTPPYMAPEQEEGFVSAASDLYSLAVLAYELLAGRRPFDGPSAFAAKRAGRFAPLSGQHGLPAEADRFFERALHPEAAQRFVTAADFRAAFEHLAGTPVRS